MSARPGVAQRPHSANRPRLGTEWMTHAQCASSRLDFQSDSTSELLLAKLVCRGCPVQVDCLDYALARREAGVWGGTLPEERAGL